LGEDVTMDVHAGEVGGTADQRREQMLRAALDVIVERGFAETRIADVAERAGTSPALVIYYFKTKDQLLTEAIRYSEDNWYAEGRRRMAAIPTAAGKLAEIVAMSCLPEADVEPVGSWLLWLDLWAQSPRHAEVASVRQKADERWRETIQSLVLAGQAAGEFRPGNAMDFAISLCALLDGLAIQTALGDPSVDTQHAFELSMCFAGEKLGFDWAAYRRRGALARSAMGGNAKSGNATSGSRAKRAR
jgi:AcrR family transcriptional regulator